MQGSLFSQQRPSPTQKHREINNRQINEFEVKGTFIKTHQTRHLNSCIRIYMGVSEVNWLLIYKITLSYLDNPSYENRVIEIYGNAL